MAKYCSQCGVKNQDVAKFCRACGYQFAVEQFTQPTAQPAEPVQPTVPIEPVPAAAPTEPIQATTPMESVHVAPAEPAQATMPITPIPAAAPAETVQMTAPIDASAEPTVAMPSVEPAAEAAAALSEPTQTENHFDFQNAATQPMVQPEPVPDQQPFTQHAESVLSSAAPQQTPTQLVPQAAAPQSAPQQSVPQAGAPQQAAPQYTEQQSVPQPGAAPQYADQPTPQYGYAAAYQQPQPTATPQPQPQPQTAPAPEPKPWLSEQQKAQAAAFGEWLKTAIVKPSLPVRGAAWYGVITILVPQLFAALALTLASVHGTNGLIGAIGASGYYTQKFDIRVAIGWWLILSAYTYGSILILMVNRKIMGDPISFAELHDSFAHRSTPWACAFTLSFVLTLIRLDVIGIIVWALAAGTMASWIVALLFEGQSRRNLDDQWVKFLCMFVQLVLTFILMIVIMLVVGNVLSSMFDSYVSSLL